jgi:hypothetical protein
MVDAIIDTPLSSLGEFFRALNLPSIHSIVPATGVRSLGLPQRSLTKERPLLPHVCVS